MSLKQNSSFQFLVGAFVLVLAFKLYQAGFLDVLFAEPGENSDGVESVSLATLFLSGVVSSVQLIGLLAIMLVSGLEPLASSVVEYLGNAVGKFRGKKTAAANGEVDPGKLANVLENIVDRLDSLEDKLTIDKPNAEPE